MEGRPVRLWQEHQRLLNTSCKKHHNRLAKEESWNAIARALGQPVNEVKTRATSLRTQFTRLLKQRPSGSGDPAVTQKQGWLLGNMDFLREHVTSRPTETTVDPALRAQPEEEGCEAEGGGEVQDAPGDTCSPALHATLKTSALAPRPVDGAPRAHASSGWSPHRHTSTPSTRLKREGPGDLRERPLAVLGAVDAEEAFGQMIAAELRKFIDDVARYRTKARLMLVPFEAAEQGSRARGRPPTLSQRRRAAARLPARPAYSPSPWLYIVSAWPVTAGQPRPARQPVEPGRGFLHR